ncbi:uncharacterized protein BO97DRAFT_442235 [Aspergillus homomorphus CBS 101889]|uniref:Myb-like domain-containing protein n=1 Tax=Aspergillus homomorphus (strain CBS 101889) TaxID=1450537 RepID=A0A395I188_ASPHC|nr:hypothetical protein BO97DRAFT_442235 [Aspergillus homomorphus CBS 101889]RAL13566.1 hypothetical protein BO97DRAFT_442235 [Aspergillus homomorphus CBS 101889]
MEIDPRSSEDIEMTNTFMIISDSIKEKDVSYWSSYPSASDSRKDEDPSYIIHGLPILAEDFCSYALPLAKRDPLRTNCSQPRQPIHTIEAPPGTIVTFPPATCADDDPIAIAYLDSEDTPRDNLVAHCDQPSEKLWSCHCGGALLQDPEPTNNSITEVSLSKVEWSPDHNSATTFDSGFQGAESTSDASSPITWPIPEAPATCAAHCMDVNRSVGAFAAPCLSSTSFSCNGDLGSAFDQLISMSDHSDDSFQSSPVRLSDTPDSLAGVYTGKFGFPQLVLGQGRQISSQGPTDFQSVSTYSQYRDTLTFVPPLPPLLPIDTTTTVDVEALKKPTGASELKNDLLIQYKQRGWSYKAIKEACKFKEAESTLRGRYRTLTKPKGSRVRKPQWLEKDIELLCEAVSCLAYGGRQACPYLCDYRSRSTILPPKVSWKNVARYIYDNGGSYLFGNATCKKKWCEVHSVIS